MISFLFICQIALFVAVYSTPFSPTQNDDSIKRAGKSIGEDFVPVLSIPETSLYTGVYYKVGLKRFSTGSVTWTEQTTPVEGWKFVQIDSRSDQAAEYQKTGAWYNDKQWFFVPSSNEEGWYTLRNRQLPEAVAYRSKTAEVGSGYHITLSRNADQSDPNALWKPVSSSLSNDDQFFMLRIKSEPNGVVTWTEKVYGKVEGAHYIQVDVNSDPDHNNKYLPGNEWHDDALFKFEPLESELVAEITQLEMRLLPKLEELRSFINTDCDNVDSVVFTNIKSKAAVRELKQQIVNHGQLSLNLNELFSGSPSMKIITSPTAQISPPWYADFIQFNISKHETFSSDNDIQLTTVEESKIDTNVIVPAWSTTEIRVCREYFDTTLDGVPVDAAVYSDISEQGDRPSGSRGKFKAAHAKLPANHLAYPTVENMVGLSSVVNLDERWGLLAILDEERASEFDVVGLQILGKSDTEVVLKARGAIKGKFGFRGVVASN